MYTVKVKQERFSEEQLTCQNVKKELGMAMNEENQRVNVDSAKKRACLQHMDYDGFRQMVLGANLKSLKAGSATSIITTHYNSIANIGYDEEVVRKTLNINLDEKLEAPKSQEDFERQFSKKFKDSMQRYTYLRLIDLDHFRKIFKGDFDSELLIKIFETFSIQVIQNTEFNNQSEQEFIYDFLSIVVQTPSFQFVLDFLGKKEKDLIGSVLNSLLLIGEEKMRELLGHFNL